jgi:mRNA interferase RelE/StbE
MQFIYSKQAVKVLNSLDGPTKLRLRRGIESIPKGDILPLKGSDGDFRLRVGDWRILFTYEASDIVRIKKIAPRGEVYKGL